MQEPQIKSFAEVADAQALFDAEGMSHWTVTGTSGTAADHLSFFRAERVAPNGKRECIHTEAKVLLELAREHDARIASLDFDGIPVATGLQNTTTHGGA